MGTRTWICLHINRKCSTKVALAVFTCVLYCIHSTRITDHSDTLTSIKEVEDVRQQDNNIRLPTAPMYFKQDRIADEMNISNVCSKNFKDNHLMEVTLKEGRIGNRLFQLFMLLATSKRYCYTPILGNFKQQLGDIFDLDVDTSIEATYSRQDSVWKVFGDTESRQYFSDIDNLDTTYNWTFEGYLQSWKYFAQHENYIRSVTAFKPELIHVADNFIRNVSLETDINVCVHVRRGDFLSEYYASRGWCAADKAYLEKAMIHFSTKYKGQAMNFIYISDDIVWCKNNFHDNNIFFSPFATDPEGPAKDLALMNLCDHSIITGGTFGWMGAWLNGGDVVYFDMFPRPGSWLDNQRNRTLYYPSHWLGMH